MAAYYGLSVAIFAPGWVFEKHSFDDFLDDDNKIWLKCAKYFYFHTLRVPDSNETEVDGGVVSVPPSGDYQVVFSTDFSLGLGQRKFLLGKETGACGTTTEGCSWFNLNKQSFQPALNCFTTSEVKPSACAKFQRESGFLGGGSLIIPEMGGYEIEDSGPLWIPLAVSLRENLQNDAGAKNAAIIVVAWQSNDSEELEIDEQGS